MFRVTNKNKRLSVELKLLELQSIFQENLTYHIPTNIRISGKRSLERNE